MSMELLDIKFWAGTDESLQSYLASVKRMLETNAQRPDGQSLGDTPAAQTLAPRLFSLHGNVGVVTVAGPLNNTDSWMNEVMGATGYPEIRAALVHAAKHPDVKAIAMDIKSGGGSVSGVTDTADLISMIDTRVKPIHAFSDGIIASAAYWLGSSARTLDIGKVTEAGSIGVITVHQDISKMYADMGITSTVLRAGKYKALGNPFEPLSDSAKEHIQGQLDQMYTMFTQHVADARGVSYAVADTKMAQGRVFIGQAAVDVGLVDSVTNFDALMTKLQGGIALNEKSAKYGANLQKGLRVKNALTEQEIAALALGADVSGQGIAAAVEAAPVVEAVVETPVVEAAAVAAPAANTEVLALLNTQLAAAQAQVVQLNVELAGVKASADASAAAVTLMRPVVQASVGNLRVALGGVKAGVDLLGDEALVAEQASLSAQFSTKFKVGGVAASSSIASAEKNDGGSAEIIRLARIRATRSTAK